MCLEARSRDSKILIATTKHIKLSNNTSFNVCRIDLFGEPLTLVKRFVKYLRIADSDVDTIFTTSTGKRIYEFTR